MQNLDKEMDKALKKKLKGHQLEAPRDIWFRIEAEMDAGDENVAESEAGPDTEASYRTLAIPV